MILISRTKQEITPIMVRDEIIQCFYEAHQDVLNEMFNVTDVQTEELSEKTKYKHVKTMIKTLFDRVDEDFDHPNKDSLIKVCDQCAAYASNFRDKELIEKNYSKIMKLIDELDS